MKAKNASDNTPLHVCAVDNQEVCARLLLFRGADRVALNFFILMPYQVAVIAGKLQLAELISRFRTEKVGKYTSFNQSTQWKLLSSTNNLLLLITVPFKETPSYNPISSGSSGTPSSTHIYSRSGMLPTRQTPSPFWAEMNAVCMSTVSFRSATGSSSSCTAESGDITSANGPVPMDLADTISVDQCDIVSDSSGVSTSKSGSGGSYDASTPSSHSLVPPGMTVVCTEYDNHLNLQSGNILEGI